MANARQCDRCGKFYEEYGIKNDKNNPNAIIFCNVDSNAKYYAANINDLCPECMAQVQKWFKNKQVSLGEKND